MSLNISALTNPRRNGYATLPFQDGDKLREERVRISFLKPTDQVWRETMGIVDAAKGEDEDSQKSVIIRQLLMLDVQSPDIEDSPGVAHRITEADLNALDLEQLGRLMEGVQASFFLLTESKETSPTTKSSSAKKASTATARGTSNTSTSDSSSE